MLNCFVTPKFQTRILPRSPRLVEIARRNLDHAYTGALGELFLESNTLAFVIEVADLLKEESRKVALIGRRHYDRAMEVRDILDANLASPPRILELAERVGMNVTTLQASFKTVFATTIFGYVRTQRLLIAQALLTEYGKSVAEVGYKVGFSNAAAFSAAYRRYFGHSPRKDIVRN
jgi:AraC-like DNA-binding protein